MQQFLSLLSKFIAKLLIIFAAVKTVAGFLGTAGYREGGKFQYLFIVFFSAFLFHHVSDPDIISRKRQACAKQGAEQPEDTGENAAYTSGMERIYPSAQSVGFY